MKHEMAPTIGECWTERNVHTRASRLLLLVLLSACLFTLPPPGQVFAATQTGEGLTLKQSGNALTTTSIGTAQGSPSERLRKPAPPRSNPVNYRPGQLTDWYAQTQLVTADGTRFNSFGPAIAISGDSKTVVVGAQNAFIGSLALGAAYIFTETGGVWTQQAKLTASDAAGAGALGFAVAISGDGNTVVVGMPGASGGANSQQGAAYVYVKPASGWVNTTETAKLTASDGAAFDLLGGSVAVSGDTVVATAQGAVIGTKNDQGAAYVYVKPTNGWVTMTQTAKLTASDGAADDIFGRYAGISGNTVVVGAERADVRFADQGAAYVFTGAGSVWTQQVKLTASDGASGDLFGASVAVSLDTVVVGAVTADVGGNANQGAAYLFTRTGGVWAQKAKLTSSDGAEFESFGHSVSISSDSNYVVVGAPRADIVLNQYNTDQGAVYSFCKPLGGWINMTETEKHVASNGTGGAQFGSAVASGNAALGVLASTAGAAYIFSESAGGATPSLVDLTGKWLSLGQRCKGAGAGLQCRLRGDFEVRNQGTQKTPTSSLLRFYLSTDANFDGSDTLLQQASVATIDPGKTQRVTLSTNLPTGQSVSGKFIIAVIDATNIVVENNETNNVIVSGLIP